LGEKLLLLLHELRLLEQTLFLQELLLLLLDYGLLLCHLQVLLLLDE
jgi:hypothetical protein